MEPVGKEKEKVELVLHQKHQMQIFQYGQADQKGLKSPLKLLEIIYGRHA